jgi:hypothetical protein
LSSSSSLELWLLIVSPGYGSLSFLHKVYSNDEYKEAEDDEAPFAQSGNRVTSMYASPIAIAVAHGYIAIHLNCSSNLTIFDEFSKMATLLKHVIVSNLHGSPDITQFRETRYISQIPIVDYDQVAINPGDIS